MRLIVCDCIPGDDIRRERVVIVLLCLRRRRRRRRVLLLRFPRRRWRRLIYDRAHTHNIIIVNITINIRVNLTRVVINVLKTAFVTVHVR